MGIHPVYAESEDEARAKGIKELAFAYMVDKKLVRITKVSKEK